MPKRILILGGYGNFGSFISKSLAKLAEVQVIIAGRSLDKAQTLINEMEAANKPEAIRLDITEGFADALANIKPDMVIHTSGPFQDQGYDVASTCIAQNVNYVDLADGRNFVDNIKSLDQEALEKKVFVVSGASSVPCLTSALVDHFQAEFSDIESLDYGITTAQKTARGLATTAAILGYTGKPIPTMIDGQLQTIFGWQGLRLRKYKSLGWRLLGNCDVPDLALFPARYPKIKTIRFYAGLELPFIHMTLWMLSWFVRYGWLARLERFAPLLLKLSYMFDWLGSANSAFHMQLKGRAQDGGQKGITFELTARSGDGPYIPCMPAIILAKRFAQNEPIDLGARACVGLITKDQYLDALSEMDISWETF